MERHCPLRSAATAVFDFKLPPELEAHEPPEARGLDVLLRGLSMVRSDHEALELSRPLYDGLYEYLKRAALLGREPA